MSPNYLLLMASMLAVSAVHIYTAPVLPTLIESGDKVKLFVGYGGNYHQLFVIS